MLLHPHYVGRHTNALLFTDSPRCALCRVLSAVGSAWREAGQWDTAACSHAAPGLQGSPVTSSGRKGELAAQLPSSSVLLSCSQKRSGTTSPRVFSPFCEVKTNLCWATISSRLLHLCLTRPEAFPALLGPGTGQKPQEEKAGAPWGDRAGFPLYHSPQRSGQVTGRLNPAAWRASHFPRLSAVLWLSADGQACGKALKLASHCLTGLPCSFQFSRDPFQLVDLFPSPIPPGFWVPLRRNGRRSSQLTAWRPCT